MIDFLLFIPACFALNLAFGPNSLLSVTYGAQQGIGFALVASVARLSAFAVMIAASALGLGILLSASTVAFTALKLVGAAYLVYLGVRLLLSKPRSAIADRSAASVTLGRAMRSDGMVALSNPKAILIFAAFFPQFVNVDHYWLSYAVVAGLFLVLEVVAILVYATIGRLARTFATRNAHWFQRCSGVGMIVFGGLLMFARQPEAA